MRNLVFVVDEQNSYARHLGVTLSSVLSNSSKPWKIWIIHDRITQESQEKLEKIGKRYGSEIVYHRIDEEFFKELKVKEGSYLNRVVYGRLRIPDILKSEERAIYLDCDMVVKKDLKEIYDLNLENYSIGAVPDGRGDQRRSRKRLDLSEKKIYFNAGFMVMDLKELRRNNKFQRTLEFCRETEMELELNEQDALNIIFENEFKELPLIWNVTHGIQEENSFCMEEVGIIHYTGSIKPWDARCVSPFRKEYLRELKNTPWRGYPLENSGMKSCIQREAFKFRMKTRAIRYAIKGESKRDILNNMVFLLIVLLEVYLIYRENFRSTIYYLLVLCWGIDYLYFKNKSKLERVDYFSLLYIGTLLATGSFKVVDKMIMGATLPFILRNFTFGIKKKSLLYFIGAGAIIKYFDMLKKYGANTKNLFGGIRWYAISDFAVYTTVLSSILIGGILLGVYWFKRSKPISLLSFVGVTGALILLIVTQQRAIVLGLIAGSIVVTGAIRNRKAFGILVLSFLVMGMTVKVAGDKIPVIQRFKRINSDASDSKLIRYETFKGGLWIFQDSPLKGVGIGNYSKNEKVERYKFRKGTYFHSHNIFITTLAERGILGFLGIFLLLGYIFYDTFKGVKEERENLLLLFLISFSMMFGLFDNSLGIIPMGLWMMLEGLKNKKKGEKKKDETGTVVTVLSSTGEL